MIRHVEVATRVLRAMMGERPGTADAATGQQFGDLLED
jgi:hypothetical protein